MGILATATVDIVPNLKPLTQGLRQARTELERFHGETRGLGYVALGAGLALSIGNAVKKSADLAEIMNKVKVTFGSSSSGVIGQTNELADKFGLVKKTTLDAAANFGLFGQAAGMSKEQSAEFAKQLVELGADLASFHDITREQAFAKLESGLTGQIRPLREIGIFLSDDAVKAKALVMGLGQIGRELTDQEKIRARFALIMEQSTLARGDLVRTIGQTHNQLLKAQGDIENFVTKLGKDFEPVMVSAINLARELGETLQRTFGGPGGRGLIAESASDLKYVFNELRDINAIIKSNPSAWGKASGIFQYLFPGESTSFAPPGTLADELKKKSIAPLTDAQIRERQLAGTMADIEAAQRRAAPMTMEEEARAEINAKSPQQERLENQNRIFRAHMRGIQARRYERILEWMGNLGPGDVEGLGLTGVRQDARQRVMANDILARIHRNTPNALNVMRNILGGPIAPLMGAGRGGEALATGLQKVFGGPKPPEIQAYQDQIDSLKNDLRQEKRLKEARQRLGISDQPAMMFADPAEYARSMVQGILGAPNDQVKAIEDSIKVLEEIRDKLPGAKELEKRKGIFPIG